MSTTEKKEYLNELRADLIRIDKEIADLEQQVKQTKNVRDIIAWEIEELEKEIKNID